MTSSQDGARGCGPAVAAVRPSLAGRRITAAIVTLLVVVLPALLAGVGIDALGSESEVGRLARALELADQGPGAGSVLQMFYTASVGDAHGQTPVAKLLPEARLTAVGCMLAISGSLYLLLALTRRRTTGVLACLALAALPPFYADGVVLRPAIPATTLGSLGMLLVAGYPLLSAARRRTRWLSMLGCATVAGFAIGLATLCLPTAGIYLLVPGFALLLVFGSLVLGMPRVIRRTGLENLPVRGLQARWMPWVLLTVGNLLGAVLVLSVNRGDPGELGVPASGAGLLPESLLGAVLVCALAAAGGVRLLWGAGMRVGRGHRVTAHGLLLLYAVAMLAQHAGMRPPNGLLAAPALAMLMAEGVVAVVLFVMTWFVAGRRARPVLTERSGE